MTTHPALTAAEFADGCGFTYRDVPICEDENGHYAYAWGHVPAGTFVAVLAEHDEEMGGYGLHTYDRSKVQHVWAVTTKPADDPDGWFVTWAKDGQPITADAPGAFALTVVER